MHDTNEFFRKVLKRREHKLHSYIYEVPFSCLVPYSATVHEIERNLKHTQVLSLNSNNGYGFFGEGDDIYTNEVVDNLFDSYEEDLNTEVYALNRKTKVMITIYEMAKFYNDGNFVYINKAEELKQVYGLLESFVEYKLKYFRGPNTGNGLEEDTDLYLLDKLATSMVNIYEEDDSELYYYKKGGIVGDRRSHLIYKSGKKDSTKIVIRKQGDRARVKVSSERLKELGL